MFLSLNFRYEIIFKKNNLYTIISNNYFVGYRNSGWRNSNYIHKYNWMVNNGSSVSTLAIGHYKYMMGLTQNICR